MVGKTAAEEFQGLASVSFEEAWRYIVKIGLAAHGYGSTAGRLESFLACLSRKLGYEGVFRSTPSYIVFAVRERSYAPQRVDLDKLARLGDPLQDMTAGTLSLAGSSARLDAIDKLPPPWGKFASMLGYAFPGKGLAPLLQLTQGIALTPIFQVIQNPILNPTDDWSTFFGLRLRAAL
ncbi:threonine/serine exporter family protein [Seongchinamella unica]|uniref:threonine/serine exporter family protein n=1 Tax=Seongchinamella unica TaxID=2547392 RepID=UPI00140503A0|nr:threonine/serine exporter family protein [Seongchinamella unica]